MTGTARLSALPSPMLTLREKDHAQNCQHLDEWVCRSEQQLIFPAHVRRAEGHGDRLAQLGRILGVWQRNRLKCLNRRLRTLEKGVAELGNSPEEPQRKRLASPVHRPYGRRKPIPLRNPREYGCNITPLPIAEHATQMRTVLDPGVVRQPRPSPPSPRRLERLQPHDDAQEIGKNESGRQPRGGCLLVTLPPLFPRFAFRAHDLVCEGVWRVV